MTVETKDYLALAKRLNYLIRELEVEALDLAAYGKVIAEKRFKPSQIEQLKSRFEKWEVELTRINGALVKMLEESYADGIDTRRTERTTKSKS